MSIQLSYRNMNADDLRGATLADYLVNIEADFEVLDGPETVYCEAAFPVAELARQLNQWLAVGDNEKQEGFKLDSLSFEDPGAVVITRAENTWRVGSELTPDQQSSPQEWDELATGLNSFIARVRADILELGFDPEFILGEK